MEKIISNVAEIVRPTIETVPLDPREMAELIQKINDMYSTGFMLFVACVAVILALAVWFQAKQNKRSEDAAAKALEEIKHSKEKILEYEKDIKEIKEGLNTIQEQFNENSHEALAKVYAHLNIALADAALASERWRKICVYSGRAIKYFLLIDESSVVQDKREFLGNTEMALEMLSYGLEEIINIVDDINNEDQLLTQDELKEIAEAITNLSKRTEYISHHQTMISSIRYYLEKLDI